MQKQHSYVSTRTMYGNDIHNKKSIHNNVPILFVVQSNVIKITTGACR